MPLESHDELIPLRAVSTPASFNSCQDHFPVGVFVPGAGGNIKPTGNTLRPLITSTWSLLIVTLLCAATFDAHAIASRSDTATTQHAGDRTLSPSMASNL